MQEAAPHKFSTTAQSAVLQARGLGFHFPEQALFADFSLELFPGVTLLRGGDGSGKTTLLRLLAGALPLQAGTLSIQGAALQTAPAAYRKNVFWAEPRSEAFDQISALAYFQLQRGRYAAWDESVLDQLIAGLELAPQIEKPLYMLSTGSKRKVWLVAAFASGAAVSLLDQPFAALDKASTEFLLEQLAAVSQSPTGRAFLIADYAAPEALELAGLIDLAD